MTATRIQSVDRSLRILRLAAERSGITLQELSLSTGMKPSTLHNLAGTLVASGYLSRTSRPTGYCLGPSVAELLRLSHAGRVEQYVESGLRDLATRFPRAVVTLARYDSGELRVAMRMSPQQPGALQRPSGRTFAPYTSASGLALLAFAGEEVRAEYTRLHPAAEYAPLPWQDRVRLQQVLDTARRLGYVALDRDHSLRLAMPLSEHGGDPSSFAGLSLELEDGSDAAEVIREARTRVHRLEQNLAMQQPVPQRKETDPC